MNNLRWAILFVIVLGVLAFFGWGLRLDQINRDNWSPRSYVANPGDCFVPPQGDPLYDAHYAQEVNQYNCKAFVNQAEAKNIDAQTEQIRYETQKGMFGVYAILGIVVACFGLIIGAKVKGA